MNYQKFLNESLIEFVKKVLNKVQSEGLKGEHHFYISFLTNDIDVRLSQRMKSYYPNEITIVLQNQFDDLHVGSDSFSVRLSFNNISETVVVPFRCLTSFTDPSVNFSLQFKPDQLNQDFMPTEAVIDQQTKILDDVKQQESVKVKESTSNVIVLDKFRNKKQP